MGNGEERPGFAQPEQERPKALVTALVPVDAAKTDGFLKISSLQKFGCALMEMKNPNSNLEERK